MEAGAIVGIVIAVIAVLSIVLVVVWLRNTSKLAPRFGQKDLTGYESPPSWNGTPNAFQKPVRRTNWLPPTLATRPDTDSPWKRWFGSK